jgi:hypothetical protein
MSDKKRRWLNDNAIFVVLIVLIALTAGKPSIFEAIAQRIAGG